MQGIRLPRTIVTALLRHAQQNPEAEVCGLIAAKSGVPVRLVPVENVAPEPHRRFTMSPPGQIEAMRTIREAGETLYAIYHSHPHAPAEPSATDLQEAAYPEAYYLIVSLDTEGVLELRAFRLVNGAASSVPLEIEQGERILTSRPCCERCKSLKAGTL